MGLSMEKSIKRLRSGASPGPDGVLSNCYRKGGEFIENALIEIFSDSFEDSETLLDTIEAWITPNWKGKNKMKAVNYRPISLTNQISKCQESLMKGLIIDRMSKAGMIDTRQNGSVKNRNILTQLLEQQAKILEMLEILEVLKS